MTLKALLMFIVIFGWLPAFASTESWLGLPKANGDQLSNLENFNTGNIISSRMTHEILQEMMFTLASVSPVHQLYIIYDNTYGGLDITFQRIAGTGTAITVVDYSPGSDSLHHILRTTQLTSISRRHVFLLCSLDNVVSIFEKIASKNLESRSVWWIVVVLKTQEVSLLQNVLREGSQGNSSILEHRNTFLENRDTIFIVGVCAFHCLSYLHPAGHVKGYVSPFHTSCWMKVIVIEMTTANSFAIFSSRIDRFGRFRFMETGSWKKIPGGYETHLTGEVFADLEDVYSDLHGRELTITAIDNNPYIVLQDSEDGGLKGVAGFEYTMMRSLGEAMNFTHRVMTPADRKWGGPQSDGTVVGMIGDVANRRAHFAVSEITITGIRETVIDFTYPHYIETLTLLSRAPREKNRTFAAFSPFTLLVWMCIVASVLLVGALLVIETWLMKIYLPGGIKGLSLNDSIFNMFRSIVKQDNLLEDRFWPHKFTFVFWYLFCLNVSALYSGILIATLIKPSFEKPIDGLTDLPSATKNGFTLVITKGTSMEYLFKSATGGIYAETWKLFNHREEEKSFIRHSKDVMGKISDDKLVLINGHLSLRYLSMEEGIRQFHFARDTFAPQYYGAACISGAPYLPVVNKMLSYMLEGGLITKWRDEEFQKIVGNDFVAEERGPRPFSVKHVQAAFYILLIGYLLGAVALIVEQVSAAFDW